MKTLLLIVGLIVTSGSFAQNIFSEDFSGGTMPAGWTVIDVDGLTVNANVSQFTTAWIVADDPTVPGDFVAMSTSWYTPVGASDDWLITPQINLTANNELSWEAMSQDPSFLEAYEVRISTTTPTIGGFNANPALFTTAAELSAWTPRSVNLEALGYSGIPVYIAFRNISNDKFIIKIDDVSVDALVNADAAVVNTYSSEYTMVPLSQTLPIGTGGDVANIGAGPITNVNMTVNVYDGSMGLVYTANSTPVASLAASSSSSFVVPGYTPTAADLYTVELVATLNESDGNPADNTTSYAVLITDSTYARDNSNVTGTLGIGATNGGQLGQSFTLNNADDITSVSIFIGNGTGNMNGQPLSGGVWATDVSGVPTTLLVSTVSITLGTEVDSLWTLPIVGGSYNLAAGEYVVVVNEADSNVTVGTTTGIFTPGKTWVNWPTNPNGTWSNNEDFNFNVSYVIRPNFSGACVSTSSTLTVSTCDTYTWAEDGNTYSTSGQYTVTLTNACGADSTVTLDLTVAPLDVTTTTAGATITANAAGAQYQWIDCNGNTAIGGATSQSYTATVDGDYAVIVTMGGCMDTSACSSVVVGLDEISLANSLSIYPNPSNGEFTVELTGLTAQELNIQLMDATGKVITQQAFTNIVGDISVPMNVNNLEDGIYFVKVASEDRQITERVIIARK